MVKTMSELKSTSGGLPEPPLKLSVEQEKSLENKNLTEGDVEMVPPDGGWGWMIIAGTFLITTFGNFPLYTFSILFSPILMSEGVSSTKIAWIFNFYSLIWSCYTIFLGPLCEQFGSRKVAIFGGLASFLSLFLSAFAPTPDYLFFTFAIPGGLAGATCFALTFMVVSNYFQKHRGFALGITSVGVSLSAFIAPVTANYLLENYGYIGAALICGSISLNHCVGASLYQPVKWHMKRIRTDSVTNRNFKDLEKWSKKTGEKDSMIKLKSSEETQNRSTKSENKIDADELKLRNEKLSKKIMKVLKSTFNNLKSLKYMRVHLIAWSYFGLLVGGPNFQMWIPFVVTSAGYSLEMAAWCTSLSAIGNIIGRVVMSVLSDRKFFNVIYGFMFGLFLMGSSIIAFSLVKDIKLLMILTCLCGFGGGFTNSSISTVMIKVMGIKMFPAVIGVSALWKGIAGTIVGPLIGVVRDATESYTYSLWILGGLEFCSFLMWLLMPMAEKFDQWKYLEKEKRKESQRC